MSIFEINKEIICLDKVVRFHKKKNSDRILKKYHYYGDDEYEENPYPYAISISFLNGDKIDYGYRTESERDEVFDKLVDVQGGKMTVGDLTLKQIKEICEKYRGNFRERCDQNCPIYHECTEYNFAEICPCTWMDEELNREVKC